MAGHSGLMRRRRAGPDRRRRSTGCRGCRPASFRSRTRATCWSACNCPTAPRWSAPSSVLRPGQRDRQARRRASTRWSASPASRRSTTARRSPMPASPTSILKDWSERGKPAQDLRSLFDGLNEALAGDPGGARSCVCRRRRSRASAMPAASPCRSSCATAASTIGKLQAIDRRHRRQCADAKSRCSGVSTSFRAERAAVRRRGRPRQGRDAAASPSARCSRRCRRYLGSSYVNQFNKFGRTFQVYVQADAHFRAAAATTSSNLKVRSQQRQHGAARHAGRRSRRRSGRR